MNEFHLFDLFPLWVTFLLIIVLILLSAWSGVRFVQWKKKSITEEDGPINTIVGANLVLLAFILAFTFGLTTNRFDARKNYMMEEVNSIETTWLRTDLIDKAKGDDIKELLKEYVRIRIEIATRQLNPKDFIAQSNGVQREIWAIIKDIVKEDPRNDAINALLVQSVNEMFDNQTKRITVTLSHRIPGMIWAALFALTLLSMFAVGYLFGRMEKPNWYMILALSLAFAAVILVIIDLDGIRGTIQISHEPVLNLYQKIMSK